MQQKDLNDACRRISIACKSFTFSLSPLEALVALIYFSKVKILKILVFLWFDVGTSASLFMQMHIQL